MKKKSLIALVMAFSLLFTGCGGSDNSDANHLQKQKTQVAQNRQIAGSM